MCILMSKENIKKYHRCAKLFYLYLPFSSDGRSIEVQYVKIGHL